MTKAARKKEAVMTQELSGTQVKSWLKNLTLILQYFENKSRQETRRYQTQALARDMRCQEKELS